MFISDHAIKSNRKKTPAIGHNITGAIN